MSRIEITTLGKLFILCADVIKDSAIELEGAPSALDVIVSKILVKEHDPSTLTRENVRRALNKAHTSGFIQIRGL